MQIEISRELLCTELTKFSHIKGNFILKHLDVSTKTMSLSFMQEVQDGVETCILKLPVKTTGVEKPLRFERPLLNIKSLISCLNGLTCYYVKFYVDDTALLLTGSDGRVQKRMPYEYLTSVKVKAEPIVNRYVMTYESNQRLKNLTTIPGQLYMFGRLQVVYSQGYIQMLVNAYMNMMAGDYIGVYLSEIKHVYQIMPYVDYIDISDTFVIFGNSVVEYCLPNRDFSKTLQATLNALPCQPSTMGEHLYSTLKENSFDVYGVSYINETGNADFCLGSGFRLIADEKEASKETLLQCLTLYKPERIGFADMPMRVVNADELSTELSSFEKSNRKGNLQISLGVKGLLFYGVSDKIAEPLNVEVFYRVLEGETEPAVFDCYSVNASILLKVLRLYGSQKIFMQVIYGYLYMGTDDCLTVIPCLSTRHEW